ncbi:MAG: NAD-dependent epimerase/dehydratase family protein [Caldilineaceae bacterium]
MEIAVTGAAGFLGRNLTSWLAANPEHRVLGCDRDDGWEALAAGLDQADFVFHLAGVNRPEHDQEFAAGNVELTEQICDHLLRRGRPVPLLLSSSIQAGLDNPYGRSKAAAEAAVTAYARQSGAAVFIYRLANVFGKWCRPNYNSVVATFCHNIARDLPITISDPSRSVTLVYVDDVMRHFVGELAATGMGGVFPRAAEPTAQISLGDLAAQIQAFRTGRSTLRMPDFTDPFTGKLYSTYLSYLPEEEFAYNLDRKCDARGCLAEFAKLPAFGQVFVSRTAPGVTRGNHYHHTKTEKFLVLEGEAIVRLRRLDGKDVIEYRVAGTDMRVVDIPPGYTHSLQNNGTTELVTLFWASEIFDGAQPDTYALPVCQAHA